MKLIRSPQKFKLPDPAKMPKIDIFAEEPQPINLMGQFPITRIGYQDYVTVPTTYIKDLKGAVWTGYFCAAGFGFLAIVACFAAFTKPAPQIITNEKPVIVEREKIVPTNCLLFCK